VAPLDAVDRPRELLRQGHVQTCSGPQFRLQRLDVGRRPPAGLVARRLSLGATRRELEARDESG